MLVMISSVFGELNVPIFYYYLEMKSKKHKYRINIKCILFLFVISSKQKQIKNKRKQSCKTLHVKESQIILLYKKKHFNLLLTSAQTMEKNNLFEVIYIIFFV